MRELYNEWANAIWVHKDDPLNEEKLERVRVADNAVIAALVKKRKPAPLPKLSFTHNGLQYMLQSWVRGTAKYIPTDRWEESKWRWENIDIEAQVRKETSVMSSITEDINLMKSMGLDPIQELTVMKQS